MSVNRSPRPFPQAAVALLAAAALLLEFAQTRLLAALYFDSFVVVLLALAVLGLGLGAALTALWPAARSERAGALWAATAAAAIAATPSLALTAASVDVRSLGILAAPLPYIFVGAALSALFSRHAEASPRLYLADLGGAGLAALLALWLLDAHGPFGVIGTAALLAAVAALALARSAVTLVAAAIATLAATAALAGLFPPDFDWRRVATPKPILERLASTPTESRWDALARVDLVEDPGGARYLYLDGSAGSLLPDPAHPERWRNDIGRFPFVAGRPERAFLIGPGGGLDLALARLEGTAEVVAVELSAASVALSRSYAGDLYAPPTTVLIDEGRSALRRSGRSYDLILLSQVVTSTREARAIASSENSLYTVEAFHDYLDHLTDRGTIALKLYDELTLTRALITAAQALVERGRTEAEAAAHLVAVLDTRASPPIPLLSVHSQPLGFERAVAWARSAEELGLALLYVPGLLAAPPLDGLLAGSVSLADLVAASRDADISPTRDDRPFFWQFERGVPRPLRPLIAVVAAALLLLIWAPIRAASAPARLAPLLFLLLGIGFFLIEAAVLQRARLYLGDPSLALSVTLGGLLIAGGLGSALFGAFGSARPWRTAAVAALLVTALLTAWVFAWPSVAAATRGSPPVLRALTLFATLLPLALPLGAPFPLALRQAGRWGNADVAWGWSVNGVASVAGALAATLLALRIGLGAVTLAALLSYLAAAATALRLGHLQRARSGR